MEVSNFATSQIRWNDPCGGDVGCRYHYLAVCCDLASEILHANVITRLILYVPFLLSVYITASSVITG